MIAIPVQPHMSDSDPPLLPAPAGTSSSHPPRFSHVVGCGMYLPPSLRQSSEFRHASSAASTLLNGGLSLAHARFASRLPTLRGYAAQNSANAASPARPRRRLLAGADSGGRRFSAGGLRRPGRNRTLAAIAAGKNVLDAVEGRECVISFVTSLLFHCYFYCRPENADFLVGLTFGY